MRINKGDIFKVEKKDGKTFLFQYLANDENCLSANVIRVFNYEMLPGNINLDQFLRAKIKFYAHVYLTRGLSESVWHKIGNSSVDEIDLPWFKHYEAVDFIPQVKSGWTVWQVNGKEKYLGQNLPKKYSKLPFAAVRPPEKILQWFEDSKDPFVPQKR